MLVYLFGVEALVLFSLVSFTNCYLHRNRMYNDISMGIFDWMEGMYVFVLWEGCFQPFWFCTKYPSSMRSVSKSRWSFQETEQFFHHQSSHRLSTRLTKLPCPPPSFWVNHPLIYSTHKTPRGTLKLEDMYKHYQPPELGVYAVDSDSCSACGLRRLAQAAGQGFKSPVFRGFRDVRWCHSRTC